MPKTIIMPSKHLFFMIKLSIGPLKVNDLNMSDSFHKRKLVGPVEWF